VRLWIDYLKSHYATRAFGKCRPPLARALAHEPHRDFCADDFGMNKAVSQGIAELAQRGRLNATSVMSLAPGWAADAALLQPLKTASTWACTWTGQALSPSRPGTATHCLA